MPLQKSSHAQTSTMTVIQNQGYIHERVSGILGLLNDKVAKSPEILRIKRKGLKERR